MRRRFVVLVLLVTALVAPGRASAKAAGVALVIVNPGGPDTDAAGDKLASQLADHVAGAAGIQPGGIEGVYFAQLATAVAYLERHRDAFVLGGLGIYLAQRRTLGLVPLARLVGRGGAEEEFSVLVRKGRYASLQDLRGKTLLGSVLADDQRYVDRFIFGGKLAAREWFRCTPTERPLSALRKLATDEVDAVLVNRAQAEALKGMPLAAKLQAIHSSGPVPTVGLMMVATPRTRALRERVVQSVARLCATEQGAPVCQTYGITGFEPMKEDALGDAIKKYDGR